jgi:hypothetical protein
MHASIDKPTFDIRPLYFYWPTTLAGNWPLYWAVARDKSVLAQIALKAVAIYTGLHNQRFAWVFFTGFWNKYTHFMQ